MPGILSGPEIVRLVRRTAEFKADGQLPPIPSIEIEPFNPDLAGPNSYDVHLDAAVRVYALQSVISRHPELAPQIANEWNDKHGFKCWGVDVKKPVGTVEFRIPDCGMWFHPGVLYLASTMERTFCRGLVPWLDGRSSIGRHGLSLHVTAGRGDDGWGGQWTLEITAVSHPVKVYPGLRCGQVTFFTLDGERKPYEGRYQGQTGPTASRLHLEDPGSHEPGPWSSREQL